MSDRTEKSNMNIIELEEREDISESVNLNKIYTQLGRLLEELRKRELPNNIIEFVNQDIDDLNLTPLTGNELRKLAKKKYTKIIKLLEKELKIVPKNYYQTFWAAAGLSAFGLPIGVVFGSCVGNMGLLGVGLPIGMVIGMALGASMDKKAFKEGRQLDIKFEY